MRVVGGDHRKAQLGCQLKDFGVQVVLPRGVVRLDFEVVAVREEVPRTSRRFPRGIHAVGQQMTSNFPGHAGRRDDQSVRVLLQNFAIDAWTVVKAFEVANGRKADQVAVTLQIARQKDQMVVVALPLGGAVGALPDPSTLAGSAHAARAPVARRNVCLHSDDRFESGLARAFPETPRRRTDNRDR